jgi:SAM-dependent methyltransferase
LARRARSQFTIDDRVVSVFGGAEHGARTTHERTKLWEQNAARGGPLEYLLPRIVRAAQPDMPSFMLDPHDRLGRSRAELEAEVTRLEPWTQAFALDHGVTTMPGEKLLRDVHHSRANVRRDLITGTMTELLGDELATSTVLDIGCNSGFFSFDAADRGAMHVDGLDLRQTNIAQAQFLCAHYGFERVAFRSCDASDLGADRQWDVVLNLGVLYHVTDPVVLLRQTYELCRRFAIVDSVCHAEPVSAYLVTADKDVNRPVEGRESLEFLPTYRAVIDTLHYVGFSTLFEIVGPPDIRHQLYQSGRRRCFLAVK